LDDMAVSKLSANELLL